MEYRSHCDRWMKLQISWDCSLATIFNSLCQMFRVTVFRSGWCGYRPAKHGAPDKGSYYNFAVFNQRLTQLSIKVRRAVLPGNGICGQKFSKVDMTDSNFTKTSFEEFISMKVFSQKLFWKRAIWQRSLEWKWLGKAVDYSPQIWPLNIYPRSYKSDTEKSCYS